MLKSGDHGNSQNGKNQPCWGKNKNPLENKTTPDHSCGCNENICPFCGSALGGMTHTFYVELFEFQTI